MIKYGITQALMVEVISQSDWVHTKEFYEDTIIGVVKEGYLSIDLNDSKTQLDLEEKKILRHEIDQGIQEECELDRRGFEHFDYFTIYKNKDLNEFVAVEYTK